MQEPEMYFNIRTEIIIEGMFCNNPVQVIEGTAVAWKVSASRWYIKMIK